MNPETKRGLPTQENDRTDAVAALYCTQLVDREQRITNAINRINGTLEHIDQALESISIYGTEDLMRGMIHERNTLRAIKTILAEEA